MKTGFASRALVLCLTVAGTFRSEAIPASFDSDAFISLAAPTTLKIYYATAGRLRLQLKAGSTTKYVGTYFDYEGSRTFPASVDATNPTVPVLKLQTSNGLFIINCDAAFGTSSYGGTAVKVPPAAKDFGTCHFVASDHSSTVKTYTIKLSQRSGKFPAPDFEIIATMVVEYDSNNRISGGSVSGTDSKGKAFLNPIKQSGHFQSDYFYVDVKISRYLFALTGTFTGTSASGWGFTGVGASARQWALTAIEAP